MGEANLTAAQIISHTQRLEDESAALYRKLAEQAGANAPLFLAAAEESEKLKVNIVRTYQETVSDALETGYSFAGLRLEDFAMEASTAEGAGLKDGVRHAMEMEAKTVAFYEEVAQRSENLLATIPGAFRRAARKREARRKQLEALLPSLK